MKTKRLAEFQPKRLTQARHRRLLSMATLANLVGLTRQAISSFERGDSKPSAEKLRDLAAHLDVPLSFLTTPIRTDEANINSLVTFRTLAASTVRARDQAKVYLDWVASLMSVATSYVELPIVRLPTFDIPDYMQLTSEEIEDLAQKTRRFFNLGNGPISDLTLLLENHGVVISYVELSPEMDGLSAWYGNRPEIVINRKAFSVRRRFDLAHELGHLVLHKHVPSEEAAIKTVLKKMEGDAHRFAGAFLLPEESLSKEVYGFDIESLKALKTRWAVSIQALIVRLGDLNLINEDKKSRLFQRLSVLGMRKKEPLDDVIVPERARLFQRVFEFLRDKGIMPLSDIQDRTAFPLSFIEWATNFSKEQLRTDISDNVILLRARA